MKLVIVLCLVALAYANKDAKISNDQFNINKDGSYDSTFDTSNDISANKDGIYGARHRRSAYPGNEQATGNTPYEVDDLPYSLSWLADENGFQPNINIPH